ncbi:hypothetical protein QCD79_31590, partial [Pseudomonas quasicaspiana]|nr:hypothetical protein [Pseudomonas quasicaspiana]
VGAAEGCESDFSEVPPFAAFGSSYREFQIAAHKKARSAAGFFVGCYLEFPVGAAEGCERRYFREIAFAAFGSSY